MNALWKHASGDAEDVYGLAVARLETELGLARSEAEQTIATCAAGYGVFLHDVAATLLSVPSLKRGVGRALHGARFDRRPMCLRSARGQ